MFMPGFDLYEVKKMLLFIKKERENIECHFTSFWVAPRMATLCITAAHRRWVKFRGSKRRAKTFAASLVEHSGRFSFSGFSKNVVK